MQRTEMADHSLESLEHLKDRTAALIFLGKKTMTENDVIHLKVVPKVKLNANVTMRISSVCSELLQVSLDIFK